MLLKARGCLSTHLDDMAITANRVKFNNVNTIGNKELLSKIMNAGSNRGQALKLPESGEITFSSADATEISWTLYKGQPMLAVSCQINGKQEDLPIYLLRHTALHPSEIDALEKFRANNDEYTSSAWRRGVSDLEWIEPFLGKTWTLSTIDVTENVTRNEITRSFTMRVAALKEKKASSRKK